MAVTEDDLDFDPKKLSLQRNLRVSAEHKNNETGVR